MTTINVTSRPGIIKTHVWNYLIAPSSFLSRCGLFCVVWHVLDHTHTHSHTQSLFPSLCLSPPCLSLSSRYHHTYGQTPKPPKPSQIEETKDTIELVRSRRAQPYHFQVRNPSFSRRFDNGRFEYCSCKFNLVSFWVFEAYRCLSEVLRSVGVARWTKLDVGKAWFEVGRVLSFQTGMIAWFLAFKSCVTWFY